MDWDDKFDHKPKNFEVLEPFLEPQETQLIEETSTNSRREQFFGWLARLLPRFIRYRWLKISINLGSTRVSPGEPLDFEVTIKNRAPVSLPILLTCGTLWGWYINGHPEAHHASLYTSDPRTIQIPSLQTYTFERSWAGYLWTDHGYEALPEGEHTLSAKVHVANANTRGVTDDVTFVIDSDYET